MNGHDRGRLAANQTASNVTVAGDVTSVRRAADETSVVAW